MADYIKRSDAIKALEEHRVSHTMSMHGSMDMLKEYRYGVVGAKYAIKDVPSADVVPKSEVDLYKRQVDELEDELAQTYDKLETAKAEVARAIFAEIEEFMIDSTLYKMPSKVMLSSKFAELKQKYIPQRCTTCKRMLSCEPNVFGICEEYEEIET